MFERPSVFYKNYLKEQGFTLNQQISSSVLKNQPLINNSKERLSLKNHLKIFEEDSNFVDQFHKLSDQFDSKLISQQSITNFKNQDEQPQPVLLNCFKNLESQFGRDDVQTFDQIIKDLLKGNILVEDLISKSELDRLMQQRVYAGFSMSDEVRSQIKDTLKEEYDLNLEELEGYLADQKYFQNVNEQYKSHLISYKNSLKELSQVKESLNTEEFQSVIEEFKRFRMKKRKKDEKKEQTCDETHLKNNEGQTSYFQNNVKKKNNQRYTAFILYIALQEMVKNVFIECKEKGLLFLELFIKYFEEQEKNWISILQPLCEKIKSLKMDRSFLLNKFIDKRNQIIQQTFFKDEINKIINNKQCNEYNLVDHKRLIMELIGMVNREEDDRYLMEVQKKNLEKDIKDIIYDWDLVRSNIEFKERIRNVKTQKIKEELNVMDDVRSMKKDDQAVLVNLERMRMALASESVQWDLEKIQLQGQNKFYREEIQSMDRELKRLRELYENSQDLLKERTKQNLDLKQNMKKYQKYLIIIEKQNAEIQTDVSFKNEDFTATVDQIIKNKLNNQVKKITKLKMKAETNIHNYQPMSKQDMISLIQGVYIRKSEEINTKLEQYPEFEDFVYSILLHRFGSKKKTTQKGQEFLLALKKYAKEDERVDYFKKLVGFQETIPYNRDILELYIMLMKSTNEPIQNLLNIVTDGQSKSTSDKNYIDVFQAYDKYIKIFNNSSKTLKEELKKHLIFDSEISHENQTKIDIKITDKLELYAMMVFLKGQKAKSVTSEDIEQAMIKHFQIDEDINLLASIDFQQFVEHFQDILGKDDSSIIFSVIDKQSFFKKYFGVQIYTEETGYLDNDIQMIKLRGMKIIFRERYEFQITVRKFLDLGMMMSLKFADEAKEQYGKIFKIFDTDNDGFICFKEF